MVKKHVPSIGQQSMSSNNGYDCGDVFQQSQDRSDDIIKCLYHPLYRKVIIAFKHGIVFFDLKSNSWQPNSLQNELQTDITDFAVKFLIICFFR